MTGRHGTTATEPELSTIFENWSLAAQGSALVRRRQGDGFGANLALIRAEVYEQAAVLVAAPGTAENAVTVMLKHARANSVGRSSPLMNFDSTAAQYTRARAWQHCAMRIDPDVDEVQPRWD